MEKCPQAVSVVVERKFLQDVKAESGRPKVADDLRLTIHVEGGITIVISNEETSSSNEMIRFLEFKGLEFEAP